MLELINRARTNPNQEGTILDSVNTWYSADARLRKPSFFTNLRAEFASYPAVPPLAFNSKLLQAARGHSQDMIARNFFAHVNPSGQDPTARAAAAGYDVGVGENIDSGGATTADDILMSHYSFMVDYDNLDTSHPLGHRLNVLNSTYTEVGVGVAGARFGGRLTQDFGGPARSYILGVAYSDSNANGAYDPSESLAGITVRPASGNWFAVTSTSGGFAIPVDPVQTVTDTVNIPFPVQSSSWASVLPYDTAYRQQQMAAAPDLTVNLTWSGGPLASPIVTTVTIKRPVLRNYRLQGTDGYFYPMSMVTSQNAKANLTPATASITPPVSAPPLRDFNADGKGDLLFQNNSGWIAAWHMNGNGGVTTSTYLSTAALGDWKVASIADMNGDGIADLLLQNGVGQVGVWYLNASGTRTSSAVISGSALGDWRLVTAADLNSDGKADIVFQNTYGQIAVWYMNGSGGITTSSFVTTSALGDWKVKCATDINGDGITDLVFQNNAGQVSTWHLNASGAIVSSNFLYTGGLGDWKVAGAADVNGDGIPDLLFQNNAGQVVVWYMTGRSAYNNASYLTTSSLGDWRLH
jgi:hypothetical protein